MLVASLAVLLAAAPQQPPVVAVVLTGANNHDWEWTAPQIAAALVETGRFQVEVRNDPAALLEHPPKGLQLLMLDYNGPRWGDAAERAFLQLVEGGVGVTVLHAANNAFPGWAEYERLVGLMWRDGTGHGAYHPFDVAVVDHHHAITAGMADLRQHPDELYHRLVYTPGADFKVLLSAFSDPKTGGTGRHEPMATVANWGKGRVFHTPLGHVWRNVPGTRATWSDPQLRRFVARGSEWAATGAVTLPATPLNWLDEAEAKDGFTLLFDGRTLAGWQAYQGSAPPTQGWSVQDAALVHAAGGGGGDLVSAQQYGDFDFRFSFRIGAKGNSGVMWHVTDSNETTYMSGPEFQVFDDLGTKTSAKHGTGALYDLVAPKDAPVRAAGTWNDARILVHQGRIQFWLNGAAVLDAPGRGAEWDAMVAASKFRDWPFGKAAQGRLALQDHGDAVAYRNLRIKSL